MYSVDTLGTAERLQNQIPESTMLSLARMGFGFSLDTFQSEVSGRKLVIASDKDTGEPAGYAITSIGQPDEETMIYYIAVASGMRNQGLGRQIVSSCVTMARETAASALITHPAGEGADKFFRTCGFVDSPHVARYLELSMLP